MSYAHVDHAGWVAAAMPSYKLGARDRQPVRDSYGNMKGWHGAPDKLTEFHSKIFDILGMTFGGIYNAPIAWDKIQWNGWGRDAMAVPVRADLASFDSHALTALTFLSHEARIRCEVRPHGRSHLLLAFWQRTDRGGMGRRHPNLNEAVTRFHSYLPADHRIIFRRFEPSWPADVAVPLRRLAA